MHTSEELQEKLKTLPDEIIELLADPIIGAELNEIREKHGIPLSQASELDNEMRYVMLGFTHPNDFIGKIEALGIEKEKARAIAHDINEQIFKEIRDSLKTLYGGSTDTQEETPSVPENTHTDEPSPLAERLTEHVTTRPIGNHTPASPQKSFDPYREPVE